MTLIALVFHVLAIDAEFGFAIVVEFYIRERFDGRVATLTLHSQFTFVKIIVARIALMANAFEFVFNVTCIAGDRLVFSNQWKTRVVVIEFFHRKSVICVARSAGLFCKLAAMRIVMTNHTIRGFTQPSEFALRVARGAFDLLVFALDFKTGVLVVIES